MSILKSRRHVFDTKTDQLAYELAPLALAPCTQCPHSLQRIGNAIAIADRLSSASRTSVALSIFVVGNHDIES